MKEKDTRLRSFMETVPIASVRGRERKILRQYFSKDEQAALARKPAQTIAGQLALKMAICNLVAELHAASPVREKEVEITRTSLGAPRIDKVSCTDNTVKTSLENDVHVSISHARESAVAVAVILTV